MSAHHWREPVHSATPSCGDFWTSGLREIRILSRDEKKQDDLRRRYASDRLKFYIGDVRDRDSVRNAMRGVDFVFHAAALKQVPSCEFHPMEAVKTNVIGTDNVIDAAVEFGVQRVLCLSTDKAVYPINAMGISKAMMEKVMVAKARTLEGTGTVVCGTRYGNVMASRGSVIPLFVEQLRVNQPLTVTDPRMTRFMMTLDDAVDLGALCIRARIQWRHFRAEGTGGHDRGTGEGNLRAGGAPRSRDPGDRDAARREALRGSAQQGRDGERPGPRRLLPGAAGSQGPELREVR